MAPSDPKVMELDEDQAVEPDPLANWRTLYLDYLIHEELLMDKTEARWLVRRAKSFVVIEDNLYRQSHTRILQCCIPTKQREAVVGQYPRWSLWAP